MTDLTGKTIAFLLTDGYEDSELTSPWDAVVEAGGKAVLIAPELGKLEGKKGHKASVDIVTSDANATDYDALMLPGGVVNADHLRMDEAAVDFVRGFVSDAKPIGVICHGGWILTDAEAVDGKKMTSYASLKTDLKNAGASWVDEEVVVDSGLVSSRTPDDLPAFNREFVAAVAKA